MGQISKKKLKPTSHHSFHPFPKIHRQRSTRLDQASELHLLRGELHLNHRNHTSETIERGSKSLQFLPPKQRKKCWRFTTSKYVIQIFPLRPPLYHHGDPLFVELIIPAA
jgi:hypothetical protein